MLSPVALATLKAGTTPVSLPSEEGKFTAHIRPVSVQACLKELGFIPDAFGATVAAAKDPIRNAQAKYFVETNPDWADKLTKLLLMGSVVAVTAPSEEGPVTEAIKLVEKRQVDCSPGEWSIVDFVPDEWAAAIVTAAMNLNGMTEEAAESARPFLRKRKSSLGIGFHWAALWNRPADDHAGAAH